MDMTMSSATPTRVEVVTSVQRRRRWTPEQKLEIVKQTNEPGSTVSMVARQFGITAAQLFQWRKAYLQGSLMAVCLQSPHKVDSGAAQRPGPKGMDFDAHPLPDEALKHWIDFLLGVQ